MNVEVTNLLSSILSAEFLDVLVFTALAAIIILGALGVVFMRNIVHSAYCLILTFLGVAGLYMEAGAGFVGIMQIMVYAGAISVLVIFAVMLVMDREPKRTSPFAPKGKRNWWTAYGIVVFVGMLLVTIFKTVWPQYDASEVSSELAVNQIADLFLGDYVVAFEAAAILLLVAVIGAIMLAKGVKDE